MALEMRRHHEQVHGDYHAYGDCFPSRAAMASLRPLKPLTFGVFEKDVAHSARQQGYGLTLNRGWETLERLGLAEAARALDTRSNGHFVFDGSGHLVNVFSSNAFGSAAAPAKDVWELRRNLIIPRQRLRELLLDELAAHDRVAATSSLRFGWEYAGHAPRDDGRMAVTFERPGQAGERDCRTVLTRALVGADGIWSRVRERTLRQLQVGNRLEYLGVLVVLGIAPSSHSLCQGNTFQVLDGDTRLYSMPFSAATGEAERTTFWQLSFACSEAEAVRYR